MNNIVGNDCCKLGFGLMRLPRLADNTIDIEQSKVMVDKFFAGGGKYFDTAFIYDGSEEATKQILCDRYPRDSYYLATKLNASKFCCKSKEDALKEIDISLERTGAQYFDFYLLHSLETDNYDLYEEYGLWDYVKELKAQGKIKHYGFSFHDTPEMLEKIINEHPDAEFVQLQLNYLDWEDPMIQARRCHEVACKYDMPIIVMEPVKGGTLANLPDSVMSKFTAVNPNVSASSWAVRYAASLDNVVVVLSGMSTIEQMEDNMSYMSNFVPLNDEEKAAIDEANKAFSEIDSIKCTACKYCVAGCPMDIHIPDIFSVMNLYKVHNRLEAARNEYTWRPGGAKASTCIECGQCESACPQHLPIINYLKEVAEKLE